MVCSERVLIGAGEVPDWPDVPAEVVVQDVTKRLTLRNPVDHSSVIIRRELLQRAGLYDKSRQRQIDYELWVRLATGGHRIGMLGAVLTAKRLHAGQSFENRARWRYVASSAALQWQAIRRLERRAARGRRHVCAGRLESAAREDPQKPQDGAARMITGTALLSLDRRDRDLGDLPAAARHAASGRHGRSWASWR